MLPKATPKASSSSAIRAPRNGIRHLAKYRLVATNAHVADIRKMGQMMAIINGTTQVYSVTNAWYHPGVGRRLADNPSMVIRSTNPADGEIEPMSPDVAVLQLADSGPDLPVEMTFATPEELDKLFAQPVAMLGFPGHDTASWPGMGETPVATYHAGVVSRITDFHLKPNGPNDEKQFVQYTMATWGRFSGSPIVLPNGHVVAIHNMARTASSPNGVVQSIPHGIRIDCLRELLVHWKLDDKVPIGVDRSDVHVDRWLKPDPHEQDYRRAVNLAGEAWTLIFKRQDLAEGADRCNKALALAPNYAYPYWLRSAAFNTYVFNYSNSLSYNEKSEQLELALQTPKRMSKCALRPRGVCSLGQILNNYGYESKNHSYNQQALDLANALLKSNNVDKYVRGGATTSRAIAFGNLGQHEDAVREYARAIEINPDEPVYWENPRPTGTTTTDPTWPSRTDNGQGNFARSTEPKK